MVLFYMFTPSLQAKKPRTVPKKSPMKKTIKRKRRRIRADQRKLSNRIGHYRLGSFLLLDLVIGPLLLGITTPQVGLLLDHLNTVKQ